MTSWFNKAPVRLLLVSFLFMAKVEAESAVEIEVTSTTTSFEDTTTPSIVDNSTEILENSTSPALNFSEEFKTCIPKVTLSPDEYITFDNGTVLVEAYMNATYDTRNYYRYDDGIIIVCLPKISTNDNKARNSTPLAYVSLIGLGISILALVLHLFIFSLVPDIRNLPGYCLASMSVALLIAYLCFVCIPVAMDNKETCPQLAVVMYYFFLSSFFWMNTIAFDVFRTLRLATKRLRLSGNKVQWKRFLCYSVYSWLVPLAIVLTAFFVDKIDSVPQQFRARFDHSTLCWFKEKKALLIFFAVPLMIIMALNLILLTASGIVIHNASMKNTQDGIGAIRRRFIMFSKLAVIMGLGWIFGLIAGFTNEIVLWYIFILVNTLQGLLIFLGFSLTGKVRKGLAHKLNRKLTPNSSVSTNQTVLQASTTM